MIDQIYHHYDGHPRQSALLECTVQMLTAEKSYAPKFLNLLQSLIDNPASAKHEKQITSLVKEQHAFRQKNGINIRTHEEALEQVTPERLEEVLNV